MGNLINKVCKYCSPKLGKYIPNFGQLGTLFKSIQHDDKYKKI